MEFINDRSLFKPKYTQSNCRITYINKSNFITSLIPSTYFCSPQYYYGDQNTIEVNPRQIQTYLCGRVMFPIPMNLPEVPPEKKNVFNSLLNYVNVGNVLMSKKRLSKMIQLEKENHSAKAKSHMLKRLFGRKKKANRYSQMELENEDENLDE